MRYVIRRLIFLIPTLFGMLLVVFMLLHITPGDPVAMLMDIDVEWVPEEQLDLIRKDLGLDRPLHEQFFRYVGRVVRGDLGTSHRSRFPVARHVRLNVMHTVRLAVGGILIAILIGVPAGIISALRANTLMDYVVLTLSIGGLSAPSFWIGILAIYVFGYLLGWFPMMGDGAGNAGSVLKHLVLPCLVMGIHSSALLARLTRSAILEELNQDYVCTAYSKGLPQSHVIFRHVLRNAAISIVAAAGTMFAYLLTGSVIVEMVFARRGLGRLMIGAINGRDFPMVQGLILIFGTVIVLANLSSDLLIGLIDPRVSHE